MCRNKIQFNSSFRSPTIEAKPLGTPLNGIHIIKIAREIYVCKCVRVFQIHKIRNIEIFATPYNLRTKCEIFQMLNETKLIF